ncbi:helix-turn-helix domain-containing protein [Halalkalibacter nanhaiisediminis]
MRDKKGYSISNMDNISSVSKSYLSKIERGLQTNPSIHF